MSVEERFQAVKEWFNRLGIDYTLTDWPSIDLESFEELHEILYHIDLPKKEEQS